MLRLSAWVFTFGREIIGQIKLQRTFLHFDERLNPFAVLRVSQLALSLPIQASGGSLKARVKDVRAEVQEGSLKLYLTYDFTAERENPG